MIYAYRKRNPEIIKAIDKRKNRNRRTSIAAKKKEHYLRNSESIRTKVNQYRKANRGRVYAWIAQRRAMQLRAMPAWANKAVIADFYLKASALSRETGVRMSVDHIVPLQSKWVCGLHVETNLRIVPLAENMSKSNRHWPDMARAA